MDKPDFNSSQFVPQVGNTQLPCVPNPFTNVEDCWKQVGVIGGNRTCPKLERFIHCRNCPIYAEAGVRLLDRELPPDYREEWTRRYAEKKSVVAAAKISVVIFNVGKEWLALPTAVFQEVAEWRAIHSLPHQRNRPVLGLVNLRGELLICISIGRVLGIEFHAGEGKRLPTFNRLLVVGRHGQRLVLTVDGVHGVHRFQPQEVRDAPTLVAKDLSTLTRGLLHWEGRNVGLLDADLLFDTLDRIFT